MQFCLLFQSIYYFSQIIYFNLRLPLKALTLFWTIRIARIKYRLSRRIAKKDLNILLFLSGIPGWHAIRRESRRPRYPKKESA